MDIKFFQVDFSSIGATLETFWRIVTAILGRQQGVIAELHNQPGVLWLSIVIDCVVLAGISERIGQSAVLFVNEVKPRRMVASLVIGGILFVGGYLIWVASIYAVAVALFDPSASLQAVVRAVGLGYVPLFLAFLALIPYFGTGILTILYFWTFTAIASAVSVVLSLALWQATLASVIGGMVVLLMRGTVGRPLVKLARRMRNVAAGKRLVLKINEAVEKRSLAMLVEWEAADDAQNREDNTDV